MKKNSESKHIGIIHYENMPVEKQNRYVKWNIPDNRLIKAMKNKAVEFSLPIMNRKWSKVNTHTDVKSRKEVADERKQLIRSHLDNGHNVSEIMSLTGLTRSCIVWVKNKWEQEKEYVT